jgi:hypothetical protein
LLLQDHLAGSLINNSLKPHQRIRVSNGKKEPSLHHNRKHLDWSFENYDGFVHEIEPVNAPSKDYISVYRGSQRVKIIKIHPLSRITIRE